MERSGIFEQVVEICKEIFNNEELELTELSNAAEIEEWDSLSHLSIISDIEEEFDIMFTLDEITSAKNLGQLVDALVRHLEQ